MAKGYKAVTKIIHGQDEKDENGASIPGTARQIVFEPGDLVKGLSTEDMKKLWDAGALEESNVADDEVTKRSAEGKDGSQSSQVDVNTGTASREGGARPVTSPTPSPETTAPVSPASPAAGAAKKESDKG
jgi:hypothetical protein